MKAKDVKRMIQQFAREEFVLYPDSFPGKAGDPIGRCADNISEWAINMWDSRTHEEIQRDFSLGLHADSYIVWAFEEFKRTFSNQCK